MIWTQRDRRRLVGLCATISGDPVVAEDLAQETLVEAWRNAHKLHDPTGVDLWLNAIARNVCRRWARRQASDRRHLTAFELAPELADGHDITQALEHDELVDLLGRALAQLPEQTRRVVVARYLEERSHADIADRLGLSTEAVSMRVSRGKLMLRRLLETNLRSATEAHLPDRLGGDSTRPTSVWCTECGVARLVLIRSSAGGTVGFRCPRCTPSPAGRTHEFDLTTPTFARLLSPVTRPTAILGRAAQWADEYFVEPQHGPRRRCIRCFRSVAVQRYERTGPEFAGASRVGLAAECSACRQEVSCSVAGMALAHRELRAFRRTHARIRAVPMHSTSVAGSAALVVGYRDVEGGNGLDVVFDEATLAVRSVRSAT